jgi:hypothetical protein
MFLDYRMPEKPLLITVRDVYNRPIISCVHMHMKGHLCLGELISITIKLRIGDTVSTSPPPHHHHHHRLELSLIGVTYCTFRVAYFELFVGYLS